ncbi:MAG: hypothetical protein OXF74_03900 [Rhodobacteraceae bacterium]|nr:hypothetical protein [Paracoccaceae bacterium]
MRKKNRQTDDENGEDAGIEEAELVDVETESPAGPERKESVISRLSARFRKRAEAEPEDDIPDEAAGSNSWERLDRLVFFLLRALLFGAIAAAAGVVTVIFFRAYVDFEPGADGSGAETAEMREAVASVQAELQSLRSEFTAAAPPVDEFSALLAEQGEVGENTAAALASLSDRFAQSAADLQALETRIAAAETMISQLETGLTQAADEAGQNRDSIQALEARGDVGQTGTEIPAPMVGNGAAERIAELEQRLAELNRFAEEIAAAGESAAASALAAVEARVASLESAAPDRLLERLTAVEQSLDDLPTAGAVPVAQLRSLSLVAIRAAVAAGEDYSDLLTNSGIPPAEIPEIVLMHAETGVATVAYLKAQFSGYARDVIAQADGSPGGITDALLGLVQIRPLSPQEGSDPPAILSRAEAALGEGDVAAALGHLAELPDEALQLMQDWINEAEARLAVLASVDSMLGRIGSN